MNTADGMSKSRMSSPWFYFALAMGWSWVFWITDIALGLGVDSSLGLVLGLLGLVGPMVAGIASTYLSRGKEGRRDYWMRIIDPRRIRGVWWAVIFLFVPVLMGLAALIDVSLGGSTQPFREAAAPFLAAPGTLIPFAIVIFFYGPFPEEFGWRGYVLDRLQERWSALKASLTLGAIWAIWHVPLFFIQGTYQYDKGAWSAWFWLFEIGIIPLTVVMTWVFNNTQRSTLAVMLFHFMVVFTDDFLNQSPGTYIWSTVLWIVAAIGVTAVWGSDTLGRNALASVEPAPQPKGQMT